MKKSILLIYITLSITLLKPVYSNGVELSDGKPMKLEIDGNGKEDVDLDIDGVQFEIPIKRKEPGILDFLPEDIKEDEIHESGGIEEATELLGIKYYLKIKS